MVSNVQRRRPWDMDEPKLTTEDFDAADEVLRLYPGDGRFPDARRLSLAELHFHFGSCKFRLYYGLRKPRSKYEKWRFECYQGQITEAQMREFMRARAERAVDIEMIDEVYHQIGTQLNQYSLAVQAASDANNPRYTRKERGAYEMKATRHFRRTRGKLRVDRRELLTLCMFLDEVRIEYRIGLAEVSGTSASNAMMLAFNVLRQVVASWESCLAVAHRSRTEPKYLYSTTAANLWKNVSSKHYPLPQNIRALLEFEASAARLALRKRKPPFSPTSDLADKVILTANHVEIKTDVVSLEKAANACANKDAGYVMKVAAWSDLCLGIDEEKNYWIISPAAKTGEQFKKSKALPITLNGNQWYQTLSTFAISSTGNRVRVDDMLRALNEMPPGKKLARDPRAQPGAVDSDRAMELVQKVDAARTTLSRIQKDLGKRFRKQVHCDNKVGPACSYLDGDETCCAFVVRFLCGTSNGMYTFGSPPFDGG